ncbi:hypothetical protein P3X46_014822 [Hevea brasiliensis]|uniref:SnoaL-like domain-containing protein n=1 Tax=Hevea brasiliensis TaxID=3981 RepID=A0ABQ9LW88_HEVBR|nr:uncharacterized protein LOC110667006 [Hevea brasiliensis]KAJ9171455.1 hypothetical protein P3X46_014822 [Hevea brasiliensis]
MALFVHTPEISALKIIFKPNPNPRVIKSLSVSRSDERIGSRARAAARIGFKGFEDRVSQLNQNTCLYGQFSAPVKQETKLSEQEEEKQNYYVNLGYAIRTLREEFPELFYRELSFDIYRDDVVFKDPLNTFVGIENYKSIFWALRFNGKLFFRALWVDVISVSQPVENVIMVRWTVHGIPRVPWESRARFDGLSEYKLDRNGKIFQHRVDNVAFNLPPKFRVLAVEELLHSVGCPSTPKPTYFEVSSSSSERKYSS